jgi:ABC-type nitrate/sulfonate/bicarbonate transport system substrate-binding protein
MEKIDLDEISLNESKFTKKIEDNREQLEKLVQELEEIAKKSKSLIPEDLTDFRNKFIATQRIDTVTKLYTTILQYRSEINKQLKDEWQIHIKESSTDDEYGNLVKYIAETKF